MNEYMKTKMIFCSSSGAFVLVLVTGRRCPRYVLYSWSTTNSLLSWPTIQGSTTERTLRWLFSTTCVTWCPRPTYVYHAHINNRYHEFTPFLSLALRQNAGRQFVRERTLFDRTTDLSFTRGHYTH